MDTMLKGKGKPVIIAEAKPTVIIGERINPTGKKKLAAALLAGDLSVVSKRRWPNRGRGRHPGRQRRRRRRRRSRPAAQGRQAGAGTDGRAHHHRHAQRRGPGCGPGPAPAGRA